MCVRVCTQSDQEANRATNIDVKARCLRTFLHYTCLFAHTHTQTRILTVRERERRFSSPRSLVE